MAVYTLAKTVNSIGPLSTHQRKSIIMAFRLQINIDKGSLLYYYYYYYYYFEPFYFFTVDFF